MNNQKTGEGMEMILHVERNNVRLVEIQRINRVGGGISPAVLPHHRTYGSVSGGSCEN